MIQKVVVLAALALVVAACMPRSAPLMATAEYEQQVRKIAAPPADRARLYIFAGKQRIGAFTTVQTLHNVTGDICIDETKIGTINPQEAMVVDIVPGQHSLKWLPMGKTEWALLATRRFEAIFAGGTARVLFANIDDDWTMEVAPGLVVTATDPGSPNNVVPPLFKIVRAASCPPTICMTP